VEETHSAEDGVAAEPGEVPYHVTQFQPSRGGSSAGVILALFTGLIGAVVLGAVAAGIRQAFWLVLLFPAMYAFAVGCTVSAGAWLTKCRQVVAVAGGGVIVGFVAAFTLHYSCYLIAVWNFPPGAIGFQEYLRLLCQAGVLGFGFTGSVIYYAFEAIVIVGVTAATSVVLLDGPFCAECKLWKRKTTLGNWKINAAVAAHAVAAGLPKLMVAPPDGDDTVLVEVYQCPHCENRDGIDVRATCVHKEGDNSNTATVFMTYPAEALDDFVEIQSQQ
jgi:hypothetical protein